MSYHIISIIITIVIDYLIITSRINYFIIILIVINAVHRAYELAHVKSVLICSSDIAFDVATTLYVGCQLMYHPRQWTVVQNDEASRQYPSCSSSAMLIQ